MCVPDCVYANTFFACCVLDLLHNSRLMGIIPSAKAKCTVENTLACAKIPMLFVRVKMYRVFKIEIQT